MRRPAALLCFAAALLWAAAPARAAAVLRIGLPHTLSLAPLYIAMERCFFRDAGLDASFWFFEAAQPIAAAAVSGDIDVGITAPTGGLQPGRTRHLEGDRRWAGLEACWRRRGLRVFDADNIAAAD